MRCEASQDSFARQNCGTRPRAYRQTLRWWRWCVTGLGGVLGRQEIQSTVRPKDPPMPATSCRLPSTLLSLIIASDRCGRQRCYNKVYKKAREKYNRI